MNYPSNNNLLIIGAGQYGFVVLEVARAMGCFGEIAFLDDLAEGAVIGATRDIEKFANHFHYGFVAIGNPQIRCKFIEQLRYNCMTPAILVHPRACVSSSAQLQMGCCIEPLAVVQARAVVSTASFVASGAVIRHDAFVGEYCHVDCNAIVESEAIVPAETKVCCNSVFCKEQGVSFTDQNLLEVV